MYKVGNVKLHGVCQFKTGCTWEQSNDVCKKEGGYLTKITSKAENYMIAGLIDSWDPDKSNYDFHIGLNDQAYEGTYKWVSDGSELSWSNWGDGNF